MNARPSQDNFSGSRRIITASLLGRWLNWLICLAGSVLFGPARAATSDSPPVPTANPTPAAATATTPAASATATRPTTAVETLPTREEMGMRNAQVHDPSTIIKCKDEYWTFNTGAGIVSWHSKDLIHWERGRSILSHLEGGRAVLDAAPEWVAQYVPNYRGNSYWAPDVIFRNGKYYLYFCASTTGSQTSVIGLLTNPTLDQSDPNYKWTDEGMVISSRAPRDYPGNGTNFNAIDPAIIATPDNKLYMCLGSFWTGIKLIELDPVTGKRIAPDSPITALATNNNRQHDVEGSYIYHHDNYYYLFVNWGKCCSGVASTYKIMIGRSKEITGPYLDKDGVDLAKGGGTLFLGTEGDFIGPGHAGIIEVDGKFWFSCHFYDGATARGTSMLATRLLHWDAGGWPVIEPRQAFVHENTRTQPARGGRGFGGQGATPAPAAATSTASANAAPAAASGSAIPAGPTGTQ